MDAQVVIKELIQKDNKRRDNIFEIYKEIEDVLQMDDNFRRVLTTEFDDVTNALDKLNTNLRSSECPILITGETSAGKSSLINLLIGRSILPVKMLSCTSTICKIWNSEQRKIVFTNKQDEKETHSFSLDNYEDKMKVLLTDNVGKGSANKEWTFVDIYIPVPLLEDNITIVDSPGIQEQDNTTLMERLFEFLPNAIAFIYVIDCGRGGGLENDQWLKKIQLKIAEQQDKGYMLHFQTETTLFVCNKWDQVNEDEEQEVMDFILHKLRSIWPEFNPDKQLFKLSCKKENKRILKTLPSTRNYTDLVEGISKMMPVVLDAKLITHVRWQKYVVQKMVDRIASIIVTSKQTNHERERRVKLAEHRLALLENKLQKVKISALEKVTEKGKAISKDIVHHLVTSRDQMFRWSESELPKDGELLTKPTEIIDVISSKIETEIRAWCMQNKDKVNNEIESMIRNEFMIIEDDLKIQEVLFGLIGSRSQHCTEVLLSSAVFGVSPPVTYFLYGLLFVPGLSVLATFPVLYLMLKNSPLVFKSKMQVLKTYVDNIFEKCVTEKYIFERMKPFINQLNAKVRHICEIHVPRKITADKMFIDSALKQKSSLIDRMSLYRPIQYKCEMLLGQIEMLLLEYFPESKLSLQYIKNTRFEHEIGQGSFSSVQLAVIAINSEETVVAVKTLRTALDSMYSYKQLSEALIVNKLNNDQQNIMKIYGISLSKSLGDTFLQIYMEYCEDSLYSIVMKKQTPKACSNFETLPDCKGSWTFITTIMEGLCSALEYVHSAGFVHRDLKLENVLVKGGDSVRLADLRLSRSEENISGTLAGTPSYMAPEAMNGQNCGSEADIYSLGIIVYELWYYRPVFPRPLPTIPAKYESIFFIEKELKEKVLQGCRPDCDIPLKPPNELTAVMKKCWDANKEERPTAAEVFKRIREVKLN